MWVLNSASTWRPPGYGFPLFRFKFQARTTDWVDPTWAGDTQWRLDPEKRQAEKKHRLKRIQGQAIQRPDIKPNLDAANGPIRHLPAHENAGK